MFKTLSLIAIVALFVCGQQMFAADAHHRYTVKLVPRAGGGASVQVAPVSEPATLLALTAAFAATPAPYGTNTDGSELWPCFGSYDSASGTATENVDCPTIGDPKQGFPGGGVVVGAPALSWSLTDCDATSTSSAPCGNTETWYEDNTANTTADLLYTIEAVQGSAVIADSGTEDFGPCALFGGPTDCTPGTYPIQVIFSGDQNFGTDGQTGKNNGNCDADFNYPLEANTADTITYPYGIAASKTCVAPVAGAVTITATTELATPAYTLESAKVCTAAGVSSPCYEVKYTKISSISQKWTIYLQ
jgi:hypothetical protein